MNKLEIRDRLNRHREHYRALPTLASIELNGLIAQLDDDIAEEARGVGKRTRKVKKKPQRS